MSRQLVVEAFREHAAPELRAEGFVGRRGHYLRRVGAVTQVIELQHSVYGGRVTANLGLGLEWLPPQIRWVTVPSLGPHAHDCTRWVRLGLVTPQREDTWWSFMDKEGDADFAVRLLSQELLEHGVPWLDAESTQDSFLKYARDKLERSKSQRHPKGCFVELRLVAAVSAWCGDDKAARKFATAAGRLWEEEKARLQEARRLYQRRHPKLQEDLPPVPDLLSELQQLTSPTTDVSPFSAEAAAAERRSQSGPA